MLVGQTRTTFFIGWRIDMASFVINSRADLDAIAGTVEHQRFMQALRGSMIRKINVQTYPDGYNQPGYSGPTLEPVWQDQEDLSTIEQFGFTKEDIE